MIAKLVAGREKDLVFFEVAAYRGLVTRDILTACLAKTSLDADRRATVAARIERGFRGEG